MALPTLNTNPITCCPTCNHFPCAVIDGYEVDECIYCHTRSVSMVSEKYGSEFLYLYAGDLRAATEISVREELARR